MSAIRSKEYDIVEEEYALNDIVIDLANEIPGDFLLEHFLHENNQPNMNFMLSVNNEYSKRGGVSKGHIGAIAHAILKIKGIE